MNTVITERLSEALARAVTVLPADVERALRAAHAREEADAARVQLAAILENVEIAGRDKVPICQDTGTISFYAMVGEHFPQLAALRGAFAEATRRATEEVPLRPNTVHPLRGTNPGDNTGRSIPAITWDIVDGDTAEIHVLPKGGGSENCSALKMLPPGVGLKGIKEAVLDHVVSVEGKPCPPTVIGLGIGGGADLVMKLGKRALLRPVGSRHPEPEVAALETELTEILNGTGVGPMGLGGATTVLAVHAEYAHRHPASLPVGIVVQCWADRRAAVRVTADGNAVLVDP